MKRTHVAAAMMVLSWAASARAQVASTCSFDAATATVSVRGGTAELLAVKASGQIRLNGSACGAATVTNTDTIIVTGTANPNTVTLTGSFAPGLTPEGDGASEIEIAFDLGADVDRLTVYLGAGRDRFTLAAGGLDVGNDLDVDVTVGGVEYLFIDGGAGNDVIDAAGFVPPDSMVRLDLIGGDGADRLYGGGVKSRLYGGDGDDLLYGGDYADQLYGGPGNDTMTGGPGNDWFWSEPTLDGADSMRGGAGSDWATYQLRTNGVTVTLADGLANDGEQGEGDLIAVDVENLRGTGADDVLVGSGRANYFQASAGADELYGGGGNDTLWGESGSDIIFGDDGDDYLDGNIGNDVLSGGPGSDVLDASDGDDDLFNADGFADQVLCGLGSDDAEPDSLDTFSGCEL